MSVQIAKGGVLRRRMNIQPIVVLKHQYGVTAQWLDSKTNTQVVATYEENNGSYGLTQVAGPWSGVRKPEDDPKTWTPYIKEGFDEIRSYALMQADMILTCLNSTNGLKLLRSQFKGHVLGFEQGD
ncbi:hypothetical protein [uncultured Mediterranean phage uvMED]|nr:hypothetical protein [uncultured Mediterranean phage uvMED]BAQ84451.1 hypothetical protein [uncultured Mediterranean phage uvMED]BAQ84498.1 hypothetical protein [uncultured Mediterranean phage uvMED]BAR14700.1 hypothetical protein [uncultured Mediterranean phage uvMED]